MSQSHIGYSIARIPLTKVPYPQIDPDTVHYVTDVDVSHDVHRLRPTLRNTSKESSMPSRTELSSSHTFRSAVTHSCMHMAYTWPFSYEATVIHTHTSWQLGHTVTTVVLSSRKAFALLTRSYSC